VVALVVLAASCIFAAALAKPTVVDSSSAAGSTLNAEMKTADVFTVASRALSGTKTLYMSLGLRSSWKMVVLILLVVWAIAVKNRIHYGLPLVFTALALWQGALLTLLWETGLLLLLLFWFLRVGKAHCALPLVFTMISMGLIRSVHQHYGMTLAALAISLWIAWPERLLTQGSENRTVILQVALGLALVLQLPAAFAAVVHEVKEPYSGAEAAAGYIRPFVGKRPIYGFTFFPVAVQPYFENNIYANQTEAAWIWSKGYEKSVKAPLLADIEKEAIAVVVSAGNPTGPMFHPFEMLLNRQQMRKTHVFCGRRFWFDTQSDAECFDIYEKQR